jgi:hypothetical protein
MKKIIAILAALTLMMSIGVSPAFAEGEIDPGTIEYKSITGDSPQDNQTIPVYGYVGEDVTLEDETPGDEEEPPVINKYEINVSVPVKIIWAAFESDAGVVTAPQYKIMNKSEESTVAVTLVSFAASGTTDAANTAVDKKLTLNMTGNFPGGSSAGNIAVITSDGDDATYPVNDTMVTTSTPLAARGEYTFTLAGTYGGSFATAYEPKYTMTFEFSVPT